MDIKVIKTEEDYKNAVNYLEKLGDDPDFENNSKMISEFEKIEKLIEMYDKEHYFIEKGSPIEIIKLRMAYMGLKQKDLILAIGSKGLVSDVLNKKRKLSKKMIRELSQLLNIGQDVLNTEYELISNTCKALSKDFSVKENFKFSDAIMNGIDRYSNLIYQRGAIINVMSMSTR